MNNMNNINNMKILKDKYIYTFDKNMESAITIESGEVVKVYTMDCYGNKLKSLEDVDKLDHTKTNPATGPIYVNGAKKGDTLKVEILDINVNETGFVRTCSGSGALRDKTELRVKNFNVENNKVKFNDIEIEINPMIGVIGTAHDTLSVRTGKSFDNGGNMDSNVITKGSIVYFPVSVDGALLALGDLHAVMGDGEISGTGIEIAGDVTIRVSVIKDFFIKYPVTETKDAYFVNTFGFSATNAIVKGYEELQRLISLAYGWDYTDACLYMSLQAIVSSNQACLTHEIYEDAFNGPTFRVGVPKLKDKKLIG